MSDLFGHVSVGIIIILLVFNGSRRPLNVALTVYFIIYIISMTSLQLLQQGVLIFMPD